MSKGSGRMEYTIWHNGEFIPRDQGKIPMTDRGFRLGDVVFDTSRTFNGTVFRLRDHLDRLYRSLKYTRIDPPTTIDELERVTLEVVERNESAREPGDDYMVSHMVTRGEGGTLHQKDHNIVVWIDPLGWERYARYYRQGVPVVIPKTRSLSPAQLDPKVKHYSRLPSILADIEAADVDPDSLALMLDLDGNISEGSGSNFFLVSDGVLKTPDDRSILKGVSRMTVLELAKQLEIPTSEEDLQPYDLYNADEAFMSTTPFCMAPIAKADNRQVGEAVPGPITNQLFAAWSERVGVDIVDQAIERAKVEEGRKEQA